MHILTHDLYGFCLFLNVTSLVNVSPCHPLPPSPPDNVWALAGTIQLPV